MRKHYKVLVLMHFPVLFLAATTQPNSPESHVDRKFDRFTNQTTISLLLRLKPTVNATPSQMIRCTFSFDADGDGTKTLPASGTVFVVTPSGDAPASVVFLSDGKSLQLRSLRDQRVQGSEYLFKITLEELKTLGTGKKIEVRIGNSELILPDQDVADLKELLMNLTPRQ